MTTEGTTEGGRGRARVGSVVAGKYRLVERLGGGGMGEVFRAENQYAGRVVALKLLRRDFADDPDLTRRFFQEAQAVNKIRHPNIVDVLDAGFCEEGPYVAMEILEGASLSTALARMGRLDLATALAVVLPMLDALDAAHRHGIVHRDLKPENVYLARNAAGVTVKLVDFGIAKVLDAGTNTNTGVVFGTPDYLSPEQASGEGVVDGRSDIFAVGIVLFELITGKRPFEAASAVATAYRIVHAPAPPVASLGVTIDRRVQEALDIALAKDPAERFLNASSFVDMLAPFAPDGPSRRAALVAVVDAVVGMQPTQAAPHLTPEGLLVSPAAPPGAPPAPMGASPAPPLVSSPVTPFGAPTPLVTPHGAPVEPLAARGLTPAPIAPQIVEAPPAREPRATPRTEPPPPIAPTLASTAYVTPRERVSAIREGIARREPPLATPPALGARAVPSSAPSAAGSAPSSGSGSARVAASSAKATPAPVAVTTSKKVRTVAWTPRSLPAHVRGRCHVRGSLPRAARRWIERTYGREACEDVLRAIPPPLADSYRTDGFNALVWYDLDALDTLLEAATFLVLGGDATGWRGLAREHFEADFGSMFRSAARGGDPAALMKRAVPTWARLYDFANLRVGEPSRPTGPAAAQGGAGVARVSVRFDGFDAASMALRYVTLGASEGLLRSAGVRDVTARVLTGEASFLRDFEFELAWTAGGG